VLATHIQYLLDALLLEVLGGLDTLVGGSDLLSASRESSVVRNLP